MGNEKRIKIYPKMRQERLQKLICVAKSNSEGGKVRKLDLKLFKVQEQIYHDQVKRRQLFTIAPNIIIQKLPTYYFLKEEYCYLEYHIDNKSLFFDEIKNGNLKRIKIEGVSLNNKSEFCEYTQRLIKIPEKNKCLSSSICYTFFKEEYIKQILLDNKLADKLNNIIVDINKNFGNRNIGFAAIKTTEGDKSFDKIMFFQSEGDKGDKSKKYLHVVECGELLSKDRRTMFENNEIKPLLKCLNHDLHESYLYCYEGETQPIDIIKNGKIFFKPTETKIGPNGAKIKPYNKYLEIKYKPFKIKTQLKNIIKQYIKRFINVQNTLGNVHMAGGPTNTLLKMPYRCVDGVEIGPNLPTNLINTYVAMPRISNDKATNKIIKSNLTKAIREVIDKPIDESLSINK